MCSSFIFILTCSSKDKHSFEDIETNCSQYRLQTSGYRRNKSSATFTGNCVHGCVGKVGEYPEAIKNRKFSYLIPWILRFGYRNYYRRVPYISKKVPEIFQKYPVRGN